MDQHNTAPELINGYEPRSGIRTAAGVLASLLWMGCPVGLTEALRGGGDMKVAMLGGVATVLAIILSIVSIAGTLKE